MVRTRLAPSPTGFMSSANLRTALYNYLFAKKHGGEFYIRIEDTDRNRFNPKSEDYIKESLEWCGIIPDDSPWKPNPKYGDYYQSKRSYSEYANYLLENKFAYLAFDSSEELKDKKIPYTRKNRMEFKNSFSLSDAEISELFESKTPYVIRLNVPENRNIVVKDFIRGDITFNSSEIDDKILMKSDGIPTYHLAHVIDDHLMETTHVIRGEEWLPSYPVHILLWEMFKNKFENWKIPVYVHLSLILNPDGKGKLSKRTAFKKGFEIFPLECSDLDEKEELVTFKGFKGLGYEPIAYVNFIALLGCSFGKDVLTMEEMIERFDLSKVSHSPSIFDTNKLNFINREHLLMIDNDVLWKRLNYDISKYDSHNLNRIMELAKERSELFKDLEVSIHTFFSHEKSKDVSDETKGKLLDLLDAIMSNSDLAEWITNSNVNKKDLREVLCGGRSGAELAAMVEILDKNEIITRVTKYL